MKSAPKVLFILLALIFSAGVLRATLPPATIGNWNTAASLAQPRAHAASVALPDGRVLIAGGDDASRTLNSAEFVAPNGSVVPAASMNVPRSRHFAVLLSDGRVLVGGGASGGGTTNSAEIYDPALDSWTQVSALTSARANATAALLQDGRVLIAGGDNSGTASNTIEIFDPSTGNFTFVATLSSPRTQQAMAVLQDGRVLIVGGFDGTNVLASSDIFDPSTNRVTVGPSLTTPRYSHSATTLLDGRVAVIGGTGMANNSTVDLASSEIFDPSTGLFSDAGANLATARSAHQAFLLPNNNNVLVVGGTSGGQAVGASELFIPQVSTSDGSWSYSFAPTGANVTPRTGASGSPMQQDGVLLLAGGNDASGNALASTEIYGFPVVKTDQSDYAPGTTVTVSGSGYKPGETVNITVVESPLIDTHGPYAATADGNGNFSDSSFTTDIHDLNVRFYLIAVGSQSGAVAQNTFTDGNATSVSGTVKSSAAGNPAIVGATITCTSGCNNSPAASTTSGAGGTYIFNNTTTKLSFGTNGPVTLQLTASAAGFASSAIALSGVNTGDTITNANFTLTPSAISTTTTVTSSANPSVFGQSVSFTATVAPASGSAAPTGSVQFVVDGVNFGAAVALGACAPSPKACAVSGSTSTLTVAGSSHSVTVNYSATGNFTSSSGSLSGGQTVNKANSSSTVVSSLNPSGYGQSVTFTATVAAISPGAGTPTGTVDFKDGAVTIASAVTLSGGQATYSTTSLNAATHSITAVYSGDANFNATGTGSSTSPALSQLVNKASLTASIIGDPTKPYDGNSNATLTSASYSLGPLVGTDSFTITQSAGTYNSKDVGSANTVNATLTPADFVSGSGTVASNYNLPTSATGPGHITAVSLSASIVGDPTKPYDGTLTASLIPANFVLTGLVGSESFTVTKNAGSYNSKDVLTADTVTATLAPGDFTGATLASNYTLPVSASGSGHITAVNVTAAIIGNPTKAYDGNTAATLSVANFQLVGVVTGEAITVTPTAGTYNSKDVASASTVTATLTLVNFTAGSGTLLSNYVLPTTATGAGQITVKPVTANIIGNPTKVYDGNTTATLTSGNFSLSGVVAGESFTVTKTSGSYNSKDVASATTVDTTLASTDFTADPGTSASNYSLPTSASGAGQITPKSVTAAIIGTPTKTYDGNSEATLTPANFQLAGLIGTESFTITQTSGIYDSKNVTATSVSATLSAGNFTPGPGTLASNYTLPSSAAGPGHITARNLNVSASGVNKVYDGSVAATVALSDDRVVGDVFTDSYTNATFADKNVGTVKPVSVSGISISGTDAANYALQNTTAATTADITPRSLTITAVANVKIYDGGTSALAVPTVSGLQTGDAISNLTESYTDPNAGTGKTLVVNSGYVVSDSNGGQNYSVGVVSNSAGVINKANVTIVVTPYSAVYDGNPHTATGSAKGVMGETLAGLDLSGTTHINPADHPNDPWSFTDATGNYVNANGTVHDSISFSTACAAGLGDAILPPINANGSSVYPRKGGSTIPVKFRVCGANGVAISDPSLVFGPSAGTVTMLNAVRGTVDYVNESADNNIPDVAFRWDSSGQQWMFNMATTNLTSGATYTFRINLAYAPQSIVFVIGVK